MTNRIRSAVRRVLWVRSLEGRDLPATGLTVWSPLADDPRSWAKAAAVWQPQAFSAVAGIEANEPRYALPMRLDEASARAAFASVPDLAGGSSGVVIALPDPRGELQRFRVWEIETMAPELAAQFPEITTYRGQGIDDPGAILAADFTPAGFHAQVMSATGFTIAPTQTVSDGNYSAFFSTDDVLPHSGCSCALCTATANTTFGGGGNVGAPPPGGGGGPADLTFGTNVRTFRLAVAATGEYTADAGGTAVLALSSINTVINSVNAIYERDAGVRMTLVANNNLIIYTNSATDPYTGNNLSTMLGQNQSNLDTTIGSANYDIGHVFASGNQGGLASLGVVGGGGKARGASTTSGGAPTGNWMTFVTAHEMGHQFNAGHAFNGVSASLTPNWMSGSAWEPGSGDSIMAYPHVNENGQMYSSPFQTYFHAGSIQQIVDFVNSIPAVGTTTATGNGVPSVNAGVDRTIPANTPFTLTMTASDPNGDPLLLGWDQIDLGPQLKLGDPDNGSSPLFRSYFPTAGNLTRTLPNLTSLLANTTYAPETLPSTNRALNFRASARDNKAGGGALATDDVKYTVINTGSAFAVTAPNTAVTWTGNSSQTITWNVAGTTGGGINTANVKISLSTDGGLTFPTTLAANTANDGSEAVTMPNLSTSSARIKVEAVGNVFFDVSNVNFSIVFGPIIVTNNSDALPGSLRAAIIAANTNSGPDTITFDPTFFATPQTITLSTGDMAINEALTITGPAAGVIVDANKTSRVFNTSAATNGAAISISNMTLTGGSVTGDGGAIFVGEEALTLINCVITGNTASLDGAGINVESKGTATLASLTLQNTAVSGNTANDDGGAIYFYDSGALLVENSTISGNKATTGDGGGIYFFRSPTAGGFTIRNSTIAGNSAGQEGGALVLLGGTGAGNISVLSSTITGNTAGVKGGGIYRVANAIVLNIENSIVAGNVNASAPDIFSAGTVNQKSSAVGSNTGFTQTNQGGNLAFGINLLLSPLGSYGGATQTVALLPGSPAINVGSSTISTDQRGKSRVGGADMGAFESQGFSFVTTGSGQSTVINTAFANPLVVTVTPVNAGEPVDGGIVTFVSPAPPATAFLSSGSATITAGKAQVTATANGNKGTYDVVALTSPTGSASFTLTNTDPPEAPSLLVNLTTDTVNTFDNLTSLREAIAYANSKPGADTISFDPTVFATAQTITLTLGQLSITDAATIAGPGAKLLSVSGNKANRVFDINVTGVGGLVAMSGLTITGGSSTNGAGILISDDAVTLTACAVVGNTAAGGDGGGIHIVEGGSLTARGSTFSGNAANWGGAIDFFDGGGTLQMENCTLSGNTAGASGGAIYFHGANGGGLSIVSSTLTGNSAGTGGGIFRSNASTPSITLVSSVVSGNFAPSFVDIYSNVAVTANFSAIGDSGGHTTVGADNLPYGVDLKLGPLADNGGPTLTHLPAGNSPLIDTGSNTIPLATDQRGTQRVIGVAADIGATEAFNLVVRNNGYTGVGSLRQTLQHANSVAGADTVTFDPTVFATPQTIGLTGGALLITDTVTVTGPGAMLATVSGINAHRVIDIDLFGAGGLVTISGLTVAGGVAGNGAGILLRDDALTLIDCAIVGNSATGGDGGGIHVDNGGSLTVRGSTISGNVANWGGGINFYNNGGTLLMENSTISGNTATALGGAIYFHGNVGSGITLRNSTVTNNTAASGGGGIFRSDSSSSTITLSSSIVSGNFDSGFAADIHSDDPVTANFSAIGSSAGHSTVGANNLPYGADLKLAPLADNGGPTQTHALLPGSAAINTGANPLGFGVDQRGFSFSRSIGQTDIGAFEVQTVAAPPTATVTIDSGTGQRSMIRSITVTFNEPVNLGVNPFTVERLPSSFNPTPNGVVTLSIAGAGSTYTITFNDSTFAPAIGAAKSLIDGQYKVTLNAGQITSVGTGLSLDGDGNGTGGDDQATNFHRLFGDVRGAASVDFAGNGFTDNVDLVAFRAANGSDSTMINYDPHLDVNGDGFIDNVDLIAFRQRLGVTP